MARSLTQRLRRDVEDAASDIGKVVRRTAPRLRDHGQDAVTEGARRVSGTARSLAGKAQAQSRAIGARAVRQVKARPVIAGAVVAGVAALATLIGLALSRRPPRIR